MWTGLSSESLQQTLWDRLPDKSLQCGFRFDVIFLFGLKERWEFCKAATVFYALLCLRDTSPKKRSTASRAYMCQDSVAGWEKCLDSVFFVLPLSSREVHKLGGRDPGPRNPPMARQHPRWQAGRRAHQQHGPVSYSGTPERCFSPRGQVRLHSGDAALLPHVSQNKSSLKSRSHSKKRERGRGSLSVYLGSQWARSRIWSEDTC